MDWIRCPRCGTQLPGAALFCRRCGLAVRAPARPRPVARCSSAGGGGGRILRTIFLVFLMVSFSRWMASMRSPPARPPIGLPSSNNHVTPSWPPPGLRLPDGRVIEPERRTPPPQPRPARPAPYRGGGQDTGDPSR